MIMKRTLLVIASLTCMMSNAQKWKPIYDYDKSRAGFEDADGNRQDMKYESVTLVDEANPLYSVVVYKKEGEENSVYGIVDNNTLKMIMPLKYKDITVDKKIIVVTYETVYEENNIDVKEIYNSSLKKIYSKPITSYFVNAKNNYAAFKNEEDKSGVIDSDGKIIIPFKYSGGVEIFDDNLFEVSNNFIGPTTIINNNSKTIIPEKSYDYRSYANGFFIVQMLDLKNKSALVDITGKEIFKASEDETFFWGSNSIETTCGYVHSYKDNMQKIYDLKGKLILPADYDHVSVINCNLINLRQGDFTSGKEGMYNVELQKLIIPFEYKYISYDEEKKQIRATNMDGKTYVYFDLNGKKIK